MPVYIVKNRIKEKIVEAESADIARKAIKGDDVECRPATLQEISEMQHDGFCVEKMEQS